MEERVYGVVPSPLDERDYKAREHIAMGVRPQAYYPKVIAPILNQGQIGSCVAHAMSTMKWYQEYEERKGSFELSTDFFFHNRKPTDWQGDGMIPREACANLVEDGGVLRHKLPTNTKYPNSDIKAIVDELKGATDFHGEKYVRCKTKDEICEAIYQYKAVIVVIPVYSSFNAFRNRTSDNNTLPIPTEKENFFGYHAICGIGYDEEGILVQNSWGTNWGQYGTAKIPYDYPISECWGVIDRMKNWDIIELGVGSTKATVNGVEKTLDAPATIMNSRTMVPLRFISEALGCDVEWLEKERKVVIRKEKKE